MKKRLALAALAATLALPASGAEADLLADISSIRAHVELATENLGTWAEHFAADMQGSMAYMFSDRVGHGKVVKGSPYSADIVTETNQSLADGNVISHKSTSRVYRDSEGRTRQETYRDGKARSIYISDPVAGMSYTLIPGSKIAVKIPRIDIHREIRMGRDKDSERDKTSMSRRDGEHRIDKAIQCFRRLGFRRFDHQRARNHQWKINRRRVVPVVQ